ncbi:MAG: phosphoenolpyruvate--protein phosphotransferase [Verrucomicrobia bacterium]|nr:phosphoenolpyruvate--protein phosphotransferase [Verrucomicrobiota bacterium]
MIKGIAVSRGIARGPAYVLEDRNGLPVLRRRIRKDGVASELARFETALIEAENNLRAMQKSIRKRLGKREADIFQAHLMLLRDPAFLKQVTHRCSAQQINIEAAVAEAVDHLCGAFARIGDALFRERAADVRDIGRRLLAILLKLLPDEAMEVPPGTILVAAELFPSMTARMSLKSVRGIVTELGGKASHASILMRSLGVPGVIGVKDAVTRIHNGDLLIADGLAGTVYVNPPPAVRREYDRLLASFEAHRQSLKSLVDLPAVTKDGVAVKLCANIGKLGDVEAAFLFNADGVGLYRTEFGFLVRDQFPTEEEQCQTYSTVAERMHPREVVIRVLDIGSDKMLSYFPQPEEANPSLGLRGTRLLLKNPGVLKAQLRAILRVSAAHPVAVLFPTISSVEEILKAKALVGAAGKELRAEGVSFNPNIRIGAMIEVPSAAVLAGRIAAAVDFLSIGTNDLIQYLLSADRASQEMAEYYQPLHPAVLQTIKSVVDAARAAGKDVTVCGEMAGNPACTELLLGFGVRSLSVTPGELLETKNLIRSATIAHAGQLAARVLEMGTCREIEQCVARFAAPRSVLATTSTKLPAQA